MLLSKLCLYYSTTTVVSIYLCDSVETAVRKRRLLFAGAVAKTHNGRLPRRVMFGALSGGEKPHSQAGQRRFGWTAYRTTSIIRLSKPPAALLKTPRQSSESRQRCGRRLPNDGTSGTTGSSKERSGSIFIVEV